MVHLVPVCASVALLSHGLHKPASCMAQHPKGMVLICGTQKQYVCSINVHHTLPSDLLFIASVKHSQWPILLVICLD